MTQQVKSIIERILRLKEEQDIAAAIEDRMARLEYVLNPLAAIEVKWPTLALGRALTAGGRLLGADTDTMKYRARMVRRKGSVAAALASLEEWMTVTPWEVPPLDRDLIGFVYGMAAIDYPGIVKIGFSRNPEERLIALQKQFRIRLELIHYAPGTELDEHLVQHDMAKIKLAGEWFDFDRRWEPQLPWVRLYTPQRAWAEIKQLQADRVAA